MNSLTARRTWPRERVSERAGAEIEEARYGWKAQRRAAYIAGQTHESDDGAPARGILTALLWAMVLWPLLFFAAWGLAMLARAVAQ